MSDKQVSEITRILQEWNDGDLDAKEKLLPFVYDELRRQADNFIELDDLRPQIAREGGKAGVPQFVSTTA